MRDEQFEAFFSYTHHDNQTDGRYLTRLCERLEKEVHSQTGKPFRIFIDHSDIHPAQPWKERIERALDTSKLLIPIITPSYLASAACREEFERFRQREAALGRNDLIFPIYYIACPAMRQTNPTDTIVGEVRARQYIDWRDLRGKRLNTSAVHDEIKRIAEQIHDILKSFPDEQMAHSSGATAQVVTVAQSGVPLDLSLLPEPPSFVGREGELAWVIERLRAGGAISITALRGMGGIGKTALAAVAVHRLHTEGRFKDGIAVLLCAGKSDAASVAQEVLARFSGGKIIEARTEAELAAAARRVLHGKDALIVLDNVEPELDIARVARPLKEAGATLLLTARHALPTAVVPLNSSRGLDLLAVDEALALFAESYGIDAFQAFSPTDAPAVRRIVTALARHTLAIKLAAINAAEEQRSLPALAAELEADPRRALGLPHDDLNDALVLAFEESTKRLPAEAMRLFAALAAFATPEFGRNAALFVGETLGLEHPEPILRVLLRRALVDAAVDTTLPEGSDRERLRIHPLVKAHANSLLAGDREVAFYAITKYYGRYTNQITYKAFAPDEMNIMAALEWAVARKDDMAIIDISHGMRYYWLNHGQTAVAIHFLPLGAERARHLSERNNDSTAQLVGANMTFALAQVLLASGVLDEAERALEADLKFRRKVSDYRGEGITLATLGQIAHSRGQMEKAERFAVSSLTIAREVPDRHEEGIALSLLGQITLQRGELEQAERLFEQCLVIDREVHNHRGTGVVLAQLGQIALQRGDTDRAECIFLDSLAARRNVHDRRGEGTVLSLLGRIALQRGQLDKAEHYFLQALQINREVEDRREEAGNYNNLGLVAQQREQLDEARNFFKKSLDVCHQTQDRQGEAACLANLGSLAATCGLFDEAERVLMDSLMTLRAIGNPKEEAAALELLGQLGCRQLDWDKAANHYREALLIYQTIQNRRGKGAVLARLGSIAQVRGHVEEAEQLYRQGLDVLREVQDATNYAGVAMMLGGLLITQLGKREEGCVFFTQAIETYHAMGVPGEEQARETARRLGCGEEPRP